MGDAVVGEPRQRLVQRHRVRCRQAAILGAAAGHCADGSEACGLEPGMGEDLAGKDGDGGLAAGAGHGDQRLRLALVEARGHQRQLAARVVADDDGAAARIGAERRKRRVAAHQQGAGAGIACGRDETGAVRLRAFQRGEHKSPGNRSAVCGQSGDFGFELGRGEHLFAGEVLQQHVLRQYPLCVVVRTEKEAAVRPRPLGDPVSRKSIPSPSCLRTSAKLRASGQPAG